MSEGSNIYVLLTVVTLVLAAVFVLMSQARRRGFKAFVTCPYRRARMLHRLERKLSETRGSGLADHYESGHADNPARRRIAIEKDTRLLSLYRERCVRNDTEISLAAADQRSFNDEARRIDAFYPERPSAM